MSELLNDRDKARLTKVRAQLAQGINPYSDPKDFGTLNFGQNPHTPVVKELSPEVLKALQDKWKLRDTHTPPRLYLDDVDLGSFKPSQDPSGQPILYCSFCGVQVDRINATFGTGPLRRIVSEEIVDNRWIEKVTYISTKVVGCPDHALKVSGTKFGSTE